MVLVLQIEHKDLRDSFINDSLILQIFIECILCIKQCLWCLECTEEENQHDPYSHDYV